MTWPQALAAAEQQAAGPEDEPDEEVNGDPDSTLGEDDEEGFDEMAWFGEWQAFEDDGFEAPYGSEDDEGEDEDDEEE